MMKTNRKGHPYIRSRVPRSAKYGGSPEGHRGGFPRIARKADFRGGFAASTMAWETSLTNRREGGKNRARSRKGINGPEDPAHKGEPSTERGFGALAVPRPVFRGLRPSISFWALIAQAFILQCRDPFSGDCDRGSRRPFGPRRSTCSAETRFQGIATRSFPALMLLLALESCSAETRFQGIATWKEIRPFTT